VAPYFRPIFEQNPKLLRTRSNKEVLERWLADHPGHKSVPNNVKTGLANLKSVMRKKMRKRRGRKAQADVATGTTAAVAKSGVAPMLSRNRADAKLEQLEMQIDECLMSAKVLDPQNLDDVIKHLRRARNLVVWKLGGEE
jgi:hypothetical protein